MDLGYQVSDEERPGLTTRQEQVTKSHPDCSNKYNIYDYLDYSKRASVRMSAVSAYSPGLKALGFDVYATWKYYCDNFGTRSRKMAGEAMTNIETVRDIEEQCSVRMRTWVTAVLSLILPVIPMLMARRNISNLKKLQSNDKQQLIRVNIAAICVNCILVLLVIAGVWTGFALR